MHEIIIYTDGACSGNPGPGGYGFLILKDNAKTEKFGHEKNTTNNRMELKAAIEALKEFENTANIKLYSDSKYLVEGMTSWMPQWIKNSWRNSSNKVVKNHDLWYDLYQLNQKHKIHWLWVKGHSDVTGNIQADALANKGLAEAKKLVL